ncbi:MULTISPECIES: hypothetical protein [unclassified Streptomyces]|uniref:hypothetical protein n=1 Tax=unclassified Streptomyces TaxID=2593676 RepID=UPI00190C349E|nr:MULTISPECIES: hypothetical protein [unclassified Streptomyces]MBK3603232.1 hypothetical protein [Streptomyces sp. MBT54]MBK3643930.1 hypothetical protein [Streptomyces sp. MBT33]
MTGDDFPAALDDWTSSDWADYRARVEDGEGSAHAIDAVQRRRRRQAPSKQLTDLEDSHLPTARRRESP